ncbi:tryptophan synthase subunit alpha [Candidatus Vidania fulgoroideorum]
MSKFIPFLIPMFPNKKYFLKYLYFLKKIGIKKMELGIPYFKCKRDGNIIKKSYIKLIDKKKNIFRKPLKLIKKKFGFFFKIILVCYFKFILDYNKNKFFIFINKIKIIKNILIIDIKIKYFIILNNKYLKKITPIFLIPYYYNLKKIFYIFNKYKLDKKQVYFNLSKKTGNKNNINYKKIIIIKKNFFIKSYVGFGINTIKDYIKFNNFDYIVIGTKIIKFFFDNSKKKAFKKIKKFINKICSK